jgi:hypothetical protein
VAKFPPGDQVEPLYSSVDATKLGPRLPPKPNAAVCVPQPANSCLAVLKFPPVAQAPAAVTSSTFQTLEVELYHISPSIGLLGSAERF